MELVGQERVVLRVQEGKVEFTGIEELHLVILMADETPTNEELLKKIEILEQELDDMQSKLDKVLQMENAFKDMGQKSSLTFTVMHTC